jgi:hypothetical protein
MAGFRYRQPEVPHFSARALSPFSFLNVVISLLRGANAGY